MIEIAISTISDEFTFSLIFLIFRRNSEFMRRVVYHKCLINSSHTVYHEEIGRFWKNLNDKQPTTFRKFSHHVYRVIVDQCSLNS